MGTEFETTAREANADGTIEATIWQHIVREEDIEDGDIVTLEVVDVEKQGGSDG